MNNEENFIIPVFSTSRETIKTVETSTEKRKGVVLKDELKSDADIKKMNEVALTIRLDKDLRKAFEIVAKSKDRSTSSLVRELMKESVRKHISSAQMNLLK